MNKDEEQKLLEAYQSSSTWEKLWFRQFRQKQLTQFAGDAALYISRYVGGKIADKLKADAEQALGIDALDVFKPDPQDRLHLVTHSLGTVILFDMLFSARWDPGYVPGHASVEAIRNVLFGVSPNL